MCLPYAEFVLTNVICIEKALKGTEIVFVLTRFYCILYCLGGFQEFSSTYQDLCTDVCQESRDNGDNLLIYCNVISTAEWEKAPPAKILPHLVS